MGAMNNCMTACVALATGSRQKQQQQTDMCNNCHTSQNTHCSHALLSYTALMMPMPQRHLPSHSRVHTMIQHAAAHQETALFSTIKCLQSGAIQVSSSGTLL